MRHEFISGLDSFPARLLYEAMKTDRTGLLAVVLFSFAIRSSTVSGSPSGLSPLSPKAIDEILNATEKSWSARDYQAFRESWQNVATNAGAQSQFQSYARLRIAQSHLAETNLPAAKSEYQTISTNAAYPESHRYEAAECLGEIDRAEQGLSARDPSVSRTKIPTIPAFAVELFVGPEGNDTNSGTRAEPFATLNKARDSIRALKVHGPLSGPVCVHLSSGTYPAQKTFSLSAIDSGTETGPVVYRADEKGAAVLYGGTKVSGFVPVTDPLILARIPAEARGKIFQCDLRKAGITDFCPLTERGYGVEPPACTLEVFFNESPLILARWPNEGFVNGGKIIQPGSAKPNQPSVFEYLDDRAARWTNAEDVWLFGYFRHGWADRTLKIRNIDTVKKQISCGPYIFGDEVMHPVPWFNKGRIKYYAFNLLEELDQPGEYYLNRKTGILYFYPPGDLAHATVEISLLSEPMIAMRGVSNVRFEGITFDLSRSDCMGIENCTNCLVAGCTVKRFAGSGIFISGGRSDGILGCDLYSLGRSATDVVGGDRATLTPARHFVENCLMYEFGRLDHTYVPGIRMEGVGIRAAHNFFHDCPSSAIRFDGNDMLMEYNRADHVVLESEDQGAMETFGNPTFRGNVLRYNEFSFIGPGAAMEGSAGRAAIRLDDAISGTLIYGNIFYHASQSFGAVNINGGRDNIIDNNIFADCEEAITGSYDSHNAHWKEIGKDPELITSALYLQRYPDLQRMKEQPGLNFAWRNIFWKCGPLFSEYSRPAAQKFNLLANDAYASDNPGFVDAPNANFALKPDAEPIARIGFHPVPVEEIGLYPDAYRASWPPK